MSDNEDAQELRSLRARAFGRNGSASADDLARLSQLEHARLRAAVGSDVVPDDVAVPTARTEQVREFDGPEMTAADRTGQNMRPRVRPLLLASAALCVGLIVGAVFGAVALPQFWPAGSPSDQPPGAEALDDGSIEFLGTIRSGRLWTATRGDGDERCLILDTETWTTSSCQPSSDRQPLTAVASGLSEGTAREYTVYIEEDGEETVVYRTIDSPFPE